MLYHPLELNDYRLKKTDLKEIELELNKTELKKKIGIEEKELQWIGAGIYRTELAAVLLPGGQSS